MLPSYKARYLSPADGKVLEDVLQAKSEAELTTKLLSQGMVVLEVRPMAVVRSTARRSQADVGWWCQELRTLIGAGMTVVEALDTMAAGRQGKEAGSTDALVELLREGKALSTSLKATREFPELLIAIVEASERTGELLSALDDFLRYHERMAFIRRKALSAAIYPAAIAGLGIAVSVFLVFIIMPRFSGLYQDVSGVSDTTHLVLQASQFVARHGTAIAGALIAGILIAWMMVKKAGVAGLLNYFERLPGVRRTLKDLRLSTLYRAFALLTRGGYSVPEALEVCQRLSLGQGIGADLASARSSIMVGKTVSVSFMQNSLCDETAYRLMQTSERVGAFGNTLNIISERYTEAFELALDRFSKLVEPTLLLLVALFVGGIVLLMYMPIFDMASTIQA
jgi:general secretion pathway protein F